MWERSDLKLRAKNVLKKDYWKPFLISLAIMIASGGYNSGGAGGGSSYKFDKNDNIFKNFSFDNIDWAIVISILFIAMIIILIIMVISFLIHAFVGNPLVVGGRRYFIKTTREQDNHGCFSFAFSSQNYMKIVTAMLLRDVRLILWTLLFIIPGIIKSYEYRMVPYILAQNPGIGAQRSIQLSRQMTAGHKFNIFILDLSFIGWFLLGMLACCIGWIFVLPYVDTTMAELYNDLSKIALEKGFYQAGELEA
ncbi:MAG: DUF975 family protein [Saccharofermentanales bacterium]